MSNGQCNSEGEQSDYHSVWYYGLRYVAVHCGWVPYIVDTGYGESLLA